MIELSRRFAHYIICHTLFRSNKWESPSRSPDLMPVSTKAEKVCDFNAFVFDCTKGPCKNT